VSISLYVYTSSGAALSLLLLVPASLDLDADLDADRDMLQAPLSTGHAYFILNVASFPWRGWESDVVEVVCWHMYMWRW